MKDIRVVINQIKKQTEDVFLLSFKSQYLAKKTKSGQFVNILIDSPELNLRRPFCVHHIKGEMVYILFRIRGKGTLLLSKMKKGDELDVLGPLGNGFKIKKSPVVLVAGGMGVAPLMQLAAALKEQSNRKLKIKNRKNIVILGARTEGEVLCKKEFESYGFKVIVATDDGSAGFKGNSAQCLSDYLNKSAANNLESGIRNLEFSIYACGPEVMFKSIAKVIDGYPNINVQASFEEFMGCGIGTCRACVIKTKQGNKRVCHDGPVFDLKDIIF